MTRLTTCYGVDSKILTQDNQHRVHQKKSKKRSSLKRLRFLLVLVRKELICHIPRKKTFIAGKFRTSERFLLAFVSLFIGSHAEIYYICTNKNRVTKNLMKMRKVILMLMVMMTALAAEAQVKPTVLGDKHAMLKVEQGTKYLLLPVQESEEIAAIAVLNGQNDMVRRLNVKLAIDRVDYFVPLEIKNERLKMKDGDVVLLDIEFHGDRRQKGAVGEFVCWKEMKYSNTFDTTNRERFRPAYHHTPLYGWMNDPNGMFYKDGVWHLYYQYNPYGSQWENMTWGHSSSRDLIHWNAKPLAIESDWLGSIFSGSCVTNGNDVVAFYTSAGHHQTQSMAVSKDGGRSFEKYSGNPILTTSDIPDFRDPKAFWNEDIKAWNLILAAGQEMRIYSSKNLKDWKYESSFGKEYGNHSGVWECPDLFKLRYGENER